MPIDKSVIVPSGRGKNSWVPAPGVSRDDPRIEAAIEELRSEAVEAERLEFEREYKKNPKYQPDPWETYPTLYEPHLVPNDDERKKLFYWIKKSSSYTAWERVGRYYKAWRDVFREAYRETVDHPDPKHGQLIADDDYVFVLTGYACFEEALARLKRGDKTPFKFLGRKGHFSEAERSLDYWGTAIWKGEGGDIVLKEMYLPQWQDLRDAVVSAGKAFTEIGHASMETRHIDEPAPVYIAAAESGPEFLSRPRRDLVDGIPSGKSPSPPPLFPPSPNRKKTSSLQPAPPSLALASGSRSRPTSVPASSACSESPSPRPTASSRSSAQ